MIPYAVSIKYMLGGYAAIATIFVVYLVNLIARWRKLRADLKMLDEVAKKQ